MTAADKAVQALREVLAALKRENERDLGPICDTIWHGPGETLFDFIENSIGAYEAEQAAAPKAESRWPAPKYTERQRKWCEHYERMTGFEPLMCDYEAGNESFVQAADKSTQWYEVHTSDMYLSITQRPVPGSEFDTGDDQ